MFTPSRLAIARKRRGMTLVNLSGHVGVTAQSLSNAERGRQEPSNATLVQIAETLRFPVTFFSQPDIEPIKPDQVSFRARTKITAYARDAVLSGAWLAFLFRHWIEERFRLPKVDIPTLGRRMSPEVAAEHVRARWGLSDLTTIANMVHLLEAHGVAVFSLPPEYEEVDAFSFWRDGTPFVILNTLKSPERGRFDAAHELGHLVMHGEAGCERGNRTLEKEANMFASAFLMPRASVYQVVNRALTTDEIIRYKRRWKVAALALAYRLRELDLLSDWSYRQSVIELGKRGFKKSEPGGIPSRETSQLLEKVFSLLRESRTSFSKIGAELHISTSDLNELTFGLAVTPVADGISVPRSDEGPATDYRVLRLVR